MRASLSEVLVIEGYVVIPANDISHGEHDAQFDEPAAASSVPFSCATCMTRWQKWSWTRPIGVGG